ncbi:coiled coil domain-containing protein [Thiohalophilus sp.]|uniref:coiled coil domain-containing protein n=1 Tax=Thiohalophilus sp. TaxID=3028392 RepID=UPI0039765C0E
MSLKQAYEQKLKAQLDEWKNEIDILKARADKTEADVQLEYYKNIESLREKQDAARNKLTELENASEDAWEDLKAGIEVAWADLRDSIKSASSHFK